MRLLLEIVVIGFCFMLLGSMAAQDEDRTARRGHRDTALRGFNEVTEALGVATVPLRSKNEVVQQHFKDLCQAAGASHVEKLRKCRDSWLECGGCDLPEACLKEAERRTTMEEGWRDYSAEAGTVSTISNRVYDVFASRHLVFSRSFATKAADVPTGGCTSPAKYLSDRSQSDTSDDCKLHGLPCSSRCLHGCFPMVPGWSIPVGIPGVQQHCYSMNDPASLPLPAATLEKE